MNSANERRLLDEDLSAWIDGELDAERTAEIRDQVEADPELAARVAAFRGIDAELRALPAPPVPSGLLGAVLAGIDRQAETSIDVRRAPPARRFSRSAMAAAALAAGLAVYAFVQTGTTDRRTMDHADEGTADLHEAIADRAAPEASDVAETDPAISIAIAVELDALADYDVIAQLEVLELLVALDAEAERS